ncbi:MAG: hypothetical protein U0Y82_07700, partial [Thermoleophilia bacterium]
TTPTPKPAPKPTPAPPHPKPGLTAAQSASRRLGSNLVPRLGQPGAAKGTAAGPRPRVTVSLQAPLRVLQSVGDLNVPVRLLSLGGAWTFLAAGLVVRRRRRHIPFAVTGVAPGMLLHTLVRPKGGAPVRFLLRWDAVPVWSRRRPRRRGGRKWVELDTPAGPGHVPKAYLRDPRRE